MHVHNYDWPVINFMPLTDTPFSNRSVSPMLSNPDTDPQVILLQTCYNEGRILFHWLSDIVNLKFPVSLTGQAMH